MRCSRTLSGIRSSGRASYQQPLEPFEGIFFSMLPLSASVQLSTSSQVSILGFRKHYPGVAAQLKFHGKLSVLTRLPPTVPIIQFIGEQLPGRMGLCFHTPLDNGTKLYVSLRFGGTFFGKLIERQLEMPKNGYCKFQAPKIKKKNVFGETVFLCCTFSRASSLHNRCFYLTFTVNVSVSIDPAGNPEYAKLEGGGRNTASRWHFACEVQ